jgi:hypothetical protein
VLVFQTWVIVQTITNIHLPIVKLCVLNQNAGYWLLSDALHFAFTICIAMKVNVTRAQAFNQPLICGDFDLEL